MRTTQIINNLDKNELLKWKAEASSILNELNWKLIKTERALYLHQSALKKCTEKLESERKRAEETRKAMQFLSEGHPLRHKCQDDLYRTEIRIFRLENKLKKFSILKPIHLEIKKQVLAAEIQYYEGISKSIENMLWSTLVLSRVMDPPDGDMVRNILPDEGNIFILQPKQLAMDVEELFLSVG